MDNELLLFDRLEAIRTTIDKHGEENFYVAFSGGKDSTLLHYLLDIALPNNKIPRLYINTGIEYQEIVSFVKELQKVDERIVIVQPTRNIREMLNDVGYPFKSKQHSEYLRRWQKGQKDKPTKIYFGEIERETHYKCPKSLMYQKEDFGLKVSSQCCDELKKNPSKKWSKENNKTIAITGMHRDEGGTREKLDCLTIRKGKVIKFHPLAKVSSEWEDWFIEKNNIKLCNLYYPPFNFKRTGCKGCPYTLDLDKQLNVMQELLPNEYNQCNVIWKPVYDEYRRIGYRLKSEEQTQLFKES